MPRGNDAQEALRELESRSGINANAEALIEANKERIPSELRAANGKRIDVAATEALDRKDVASAVKDQGKLIEADAAFAVRGDTVVALVHVDDRGRVEKAHVPLDEVKGSRKAKKATKDEKVKADEPAADADEDKE